MSFLQVTPSIEILLRALQPLISLKL
jgi:hypothetical protein